jgi:hypothetical protein
MAYSLLAFTAHTSLTQNYFYYLQLDIDAI